MLQDQVYYLVWDSNAFPGPIDSPLTAAVSTILPATASPAQAKSVSTPTTIPTPTASAKSGSLSMGAKAGIGIGTAAGVLGLIGLARLLALGRKRRRLSERPMDVSNDDNVEVQQGGQAGQDDKKSASYFGMLEKSQAAELNTERPMGELRG